MRNEKEEPETFNLYFAGAGGSGRTALAQRLYFDCGGLKPREREKLRLETEEARERGRFGIYSQRMGRVRKDTEHGTAGLGREISDFEYYLESIFSDEVARLRERGPMYCCLRLNFYSGNRKFEVRDGPGETGGIAHSKLRRLAQEDFGKWILVNQYNLDVAVIIVEAAVVHDLKLSKAQRDANRFLLKSQQNYSHLPEDKLATTKRHANLLHMLGFKQIIVVINKMDEVKYSQCCFEELKAYMTELLIRVGYSRKYVCSAVPFIPMAALDGANVASQQFRATMLPPNCISELTDRIETAALEEMKWWKGSTLIFPSGDVRTVWNLVDALENCPIAITRAETGLCTPQRLRLFSAPSIPILMLSTNPASCDPLATTSSTSTESSTTLVSLLKPIGNCCESSASLCAFVTGVYKVKGLGNVLTARIVKGAVRIGDDVMFSPTDSREYPCRGRVRSMEQKEQHIDFASAGSEIGIRMEGLSRDHLPKVCDLMVRISESMSRASRLFLALVTVLESDETNKTAFTLSVEDAFPHAEGNPLVMLTARKSSARLKSINWRRGPSTGYMKCPNSNELHAGDEAEVEIELLNPLVLEPYDQCETMGRFLFEIYSRTCMIGRVLRVTPLSEEEELAFAKQRAPKSVVSPIQSKPKTQEKPSNK